MRQTNWRFVVAGGIAVVFSGVFLAFMTSIAPQSTDPVALMQTAGTVSGVVSAIGFVLIVLGFLGKKF